jgi:tRNA threonylcarbamoyladenosine biosynthesis protein TsaB
MPPRLLILETSDRVGQVAVAEGPVLRAVQRLDASRRHARDLAPAVKALLEEQQWKATDLAAVIVSRGPGSYTGLRVGIISAKTLAYATGCALIGVETFAAIAQQAPRECGRVDVLADAQQDKVYVQGFERRGEAVTAVTPLAIVPFSAWLAQRDPTAAVSGPGLHKWAERVPEAIPRVESSFWQPRVESLLVLGLARIEAGERDDPIALEPLYLRPSSAEEQWRGR